MIAKVVQRLTWLDNIFLLNLKRKENFISERKMKLIMINGILMQIFLCIFVIVEKIFSWFCLMIFCLFQEFLFQLFLESLYWGCVLFGPCLTDVFCFGGFYLPYREFSRFFNWILCVMFGLLGFRLLTAKIFDSIWLDMCVA